MAIRSCKLGVFALHFASSRRDNKITVQAREYNKQRITFTAIDTTHRPARPIGVELYEKHISAVSPKVHNCEPSPALIPAAVTAAV